VFEHINPPAGFPALQSSAGCGTDEVRFFAASLAFSDGFETGKYRQRHFLNDDSMPQGEEPRHHPIEPAGSTVQSSALREPGGPRPPAASA